MRWNLWKQLTPEEKEEYDFKFDYNILQFPLSRIVSANLFRCIVFYFLLLIMSLLISSPTPDVLALMTTALLHVFFYFPRVVLLFLAIDLLIMMVSIHERISWVDKRMKVKHETVIERVEVKE